MKGILAIAFALTLALGYLALHAQNNQKLETNFAAANSADSELASLDPGAAAPSENSAPELAKVAKGPVVSNLTRSSASIAWITDGDAATEVRYSSDGKHWRTAFKPGDEREHVVNITRLNPNTGYQFRIMTRQNGVSSVGAFHTNPR